LVVVVVLLNRKNPFPQRFAVSLAFLDFPVEKPHGEAKESNAETLAADLFGYVVKERVH